MGVPVLLVMAFFLPVLPVLKLAVPAQHYLLHIYSFSQLSSHLCKISLFVSKDNTFLGCFAGGKAMEKKINSSVDKTRSSLDVKAGTEAKPSADAVHHPPAQHPM